MVGGTDRGRRVEPYAVDRRPRPRAPARDPAGARAGRRRAWWPTGSGCARCAPRCAWRPRAGWCTATATAVPGSRCVGLRRRGRRAGRDPRLSLRRSPPDVTGHTPDRPVTRGRMPGMAPGHVSSRPSASSDWAPWGPASRRSSPGTATTSSASRSTTTGVAKGRQHLESSTARAVKRGKLTEEEQAELLGRVTLRHLDGGARRRRPRRRGGRGVAVGEEADLRRPRVGRKPEDAVLATNTSSLSVTEISTANASPGRVVGVHFFNPAPVQGFVEVVRTVVTEPVGGRGRLGAGAHAGQEPRRVRRQGRLHRQHPALRLPQPRGVDVREPLRLPRGHRRRDALRLRLPDGARWPCST